MEKIIKKSIIKIVIILIAVIFASTMFSTNEVQANAFLDILTDAGQNLINAVLQLVMWLADFILQYMQDIMVGVWEIEDYRGETKIQYSPGIIFLDRVAGLKVDFVGASKDDKEVRYNVKTVLGNEEEIVGVAKQIKDNNRQAQEVWTGTYKYKRKDEELNREGNSVEIGGGFAPFNSNDFSKGVTLYGYGAFKYKSGKDIKWGNEKEYTLEDLGILEVSFVPIYTKEFRNSDGCCFYSIR